MIQETGIVEHIEEEYAFIKAERSGTCKSCSSQSMCNPSDGKEYVIVQAVNRIGAKPGDSVKFEVPASSFLKASFLVYVFPLIALMMGAIVGKIAYPTFKESFTKDGTSALFALIFLIISILVVKVAGKKTNDDEKYFPKIISIIGSDYEH